MSSRPFSGAFSRRAAAIIVLVPVIFPGVTAAKKAPATVGVLRFTDAAGGTRAARIQSLVIGAARRDRLFGLPAGTPAAAWHPYPAGAAPAAKELARYRETGVRLHATHLLVGRIFMQGAVPVMEARLFSMEDSTLLPPLVETLSGGDFRAPATSLAIRTARLLEGVLPLVAGLTVSRGSSPDHVALGWKCTARDASFTVERAPWQTGPWTVIGETDESNFLDDGADEGLLFWYRVTPAKGGLRGNGMEGSGYRKPANPKGLSYDEIMSTRNKPWPEPATGADREREERHLPLFRKYYESYFMMTFIFMVGRIYVKSGELLVYRDLPNYSLDWANRTVYFSRPGSFTVKFYSRRFYRFLRDMYFMEIPFDELLPRVMDNSFLFCVRSGETETRQADRRIRYLPRFDAVGMGTEYHRDYEKWRGNSIMFATSDEELYRRIRQAQLKGY